MGNGRFRISLEIIEVLLRTGHQFPAYEILEGIPDDGKIVSVEPLAEDQRVLDVMVESKKFPAGKITEFDIVVLRSTGHNRIESAGSA